MTSRTTSMLPWIVGFKAIKATLLVALGITLLFVARRDAVGLLIDVALAVHVPVTSRVFDRLLVLAFQATPGKERALAVTAFGYAILMGTEGVGLYLRRRWARWFTIVATSSLIPLEIYEIIRDVRPLRVLVLILNAAIVVYLWKRREAFE